jgi:hypothetical protein
MRTFLLLLCAIGISTSAVAQTPFDGKWVAEVVRPAPAGNQNITLDLKTSEGKVSGSLTVQGAAPSPISWGMVKGDLITFKVTQPGANNTQLTMVYLGRLDGARIQFGRRPEDLSVGRLVEFTATHGK